MKRKSDSAPSGLSASMARLWRETISTWRLDPPGLAILENMCRSIDRLRKAEGVVRKDGVSCVDRVGQLRAHPLLATIRDENVTICRCLHQLGLDLEGVSLAGPGPGNEEL